ncbi:MAG: prohibitin family protein, partial [Ignavibacteriae bacterium]|nr:prohibitin family protein [Ignavibacteriota bacterium]
MLFILSVVVVVVAFFAWQTAKKRMLVNAMYRTTSNIALVVMVFFAIVALSQCFAVVPAGHVGVVDFLGTVNDRPLPAGVNIVNPFARIHKYSVQTKEHKETMRVLSREGLTIELEISVLYRLNPDSAARVYQSIVGGDYEGVVLVPQFRSISRSVTASFQASALYSTEREQLGISILAELAKAVAARGVIVESTPLRNVG